MAVKPKVLLVDDEERILRSLGMLLRMQYEVFATSDGHEALAILQREKIHVLISDQRMPIMSGSELLQRARSIAPDTVRILLTGYADVDAGLAALNDGEIFRYINKPWGPKELRDTIADAVDVAVQLEGVECAVGHAESPVVMMEQSLVCLVLDRDENTYIAVKEILGEQHHVLWRHSVTEALEVLATHPVAILITELSVGNEDLSAVIKTLKREHPELLTIILTCFKDTSRLVDLINQAQVFRYLPKPIRKGLLGRSIDSTIAKYRTLSQQPALLVTQKVEAPREPLQAEAIDKVSQYLQRLRGKTLFPRQPLA